jgi:SAM-dependent methyltransferase
MKSDIKILCCPKCKSQLKENNGIILCSNIECSYSDSPFPFIDDKLILVNFDDSVIQYDSLLNSDASSLVKRTIKFSKLEKFAKSLLNGVNKLSANNIETCIGLLKDINNPRILIIGGGTVGAGCEYIVNNFQDAITSFDIYNSVNVDFIADAHSIPLKDETFDLIIIQAVLEHVLSPNKVVDECYRVLKTCGYIYAETPFLQAVHEGAYDFTRYTVLGHRILFEKFKKIGTGFNGGIGQSLLWSLEYFSRAVFRSRIAGKIVKACFFWLRWIEKIIPDSYNQDGACGSYFIGQKSIIMSEMSYFDFINGYEGAQK